MENTNTAKTTSDTSKDLPSANPNQQYKGQEGESHSTAAEGTLKTPDQLEKTFGSTFEASEEQDIDDLLHTPETFEEGENQRGGQATSLNQEDKFTPDDISS